MTRVWHVLLFLTCAITSARSRGENEEYYDSNMESYDDDYETVQDSAHLVPFEHAQTDFHGENLIIVPCQHHDNVRVCDCGFSNQEMTMPVLFGTLLHIVVRNCKRVQLRNGTFAGLTHLNSLSFTNIEDLILHEHGVSFPRPDSTLRVQIVFTNVILETLPRYSINGNIQSITFEKCRIGVIEQFSITGIRSQLHLFRILDSTVNRFEPQAVKKFTILLLDINNMTVTNDIPSRTFYDIEVSQLFSIANSDINRIHSSAFLMKDVTRFILQHNVIKLLNGEAFQMAIINEVQIAHNQILDIHPAAFRSIALHSSYWRNNNMPLPFRLSSNQITMTPEPAAFQIDSTFNTIVQNLTYTNQISCNTVGSFHNDPFFNDNSVQIYFPFEEATDPTKLHTIGKLMHIRCVENSWFWYYVLIGTAVIFTLLIALIIGLCVWWKRRQARRMNIVMPEGKTYRETQIVMQIENHGLLKTDL